VNSPAESLRGEVQADLLNACSVHAPGRSVNAVTVSAAGRYARGSLRSSRSRPQVVSGKGWHSLGQGQKRAGGRTTTDPTPCTFRRKWGTDRHHLPRRHSEPCSSGSHRGTRPNSPGRQVEGTPKPAKKKAPLPAPTGVNRAGPMGSAPPYPAPRRGEGARRPSCPGHLPADQQGSPGYERGARRAPREPGGEFSPRAGYRSVGPSRQPPRWRHTRPPCHSASPVRAVRIVLEVGS
jgi:hypothetical protein